MESLLNAYIPADRQIALATGRALPEHVCGAVLYIDISGFTALTEALTHSLGAQRGIEELARQINQVYSTLIDELNHFGGSVISFNGDSLICWFNASTPDQIDDTALRALATARAMHAVMSLIGAVALPNGENSLLAIKAALAAGTARRMVIGDPAMHLIDTLAGDALVRAVAAESVAQRGEIIIDGATARRLSARLHITSWRVSTSDPTCDYAVVAGYSGSVAPQPWPQFVQLDPELAQPWLLPAIYQRLHAGLSEFTTELRPTVALFSRFGGIDFDRDPAAAAKLDSYVRWAQAVLARHQGTLVQVTLGEKGNFFYAAFGAPISYERDVSSALAAALAFCSPPAEFHLLDKVQIGITSGMMRSGAYGGRTRRTYGVLGDEVNLAARLMMQASPGQVFVTERIVAAAAAEFDFEQIGPLPVKGKRAPVQVYALQSRRLNAHDHTKHGGRDQPGSYTMIGREDEQALLQEHMQALKQHGQGGVICIEGEPGIGKSRLIAELRTQARSLGLTSFIGAASAAEHATLYYVWRDIFSQMLDLNVLTEPTQRRHHLYNLLEDEPDLLALAPLLNTIMLLELPDNATTSPLNGDARAEQTREMLLSFLRYSTTRSPKIVILEDAHWLDSASWALALEVCQQIPRTLLVISTRPISTPQPEHYRRLLDSPRARRIPLAALPFDECLALVCQSLGVRAIPEPVAALLREKAQGNPFFSEELVHTLRDAGFLRIADGTCELACRPEQLHQLAFSDSVHGVISSRIDRLAPLEQLTIKVASVIGRSFALDLLREIYPIRPGASQLEQHLSILEQLEHMRVDTPAPDLSYIFRHVITQEVAYNSMLFAQRRSLHRAVAEWFERTHADDLVPYYPLLAHHWGRADARQQALFYLDQAHDQAVRDGATQEALQFLDQARQLLAANALEL
ncbi:MAG: AAA family ATPase [Roseiflexaceae bacterium]|nr:AAA family ATPase [Roseiflexaceae bacterium]